MFWPWFFFFSPSGGEGCCGGGDFCWLWVMFMGVVELCFGCGWCWVVAVVRGCHGGGGFDECGCGWVFSSVAIQLWLLVA